MRKKIISVGVSLVLLLSMGTFVASGMSSLEPDKTRETEILNELAEGNNIQTKDEYGVVPYPHGTCMRCSEWCYTVCAADGEIDAVWYHDTLFTEDCKVTLLRSRGYSMCDDCFFINEEHGYHDCWEVHTKCSKGQYDVCTMERS